MAYARSRSRGVSMPTLILLFVLFIPVAAAGSVGTLWALGAIDLPFLSRGSGIPKDAIAVPISPQALPAYTKLTRDHLFDPRQGRLAALYLKPSDVTPEMITSLSQILGRVLDHEKPAGYVFTESDFLPKGTRPGLVAGIPPGKRSLTLEADKIAGIYSLKANDHIDLVASVQVEMPRGGGGALGKGFQAQVEVARMEKASKVNVLAQNAVLITPVTTRQKPLTSSSLKGVQTRMIPVQEVVIAVDPEEVPIVTAAMASNLNITCVARSGLPDDPGAEIDTPGYDPLGNLAPPVETIVGTRRDQHVFYNRRAKDGANGNLVWPASTKKTKAEEESLLSDDEAKKKGKSG